MISEEQQKKDERYMRMALDEAQIAYEAGEIPIGAVVVCKDRVISRAHNLTETLCDVTAHDRCCQHPGRQVSHRLHPLRHCGAVCDVRRCHRMVTAPSYCLWMYRRQTGISRVCASCHAPQGHHHRGCPRRGMPHTDAGLLQI